MNISAPDESLEAHDGSLETGTREDVLTYTVQVARSREGGVLLALAACVLLIAAVRPADAQGDPAGADDGQTDGFGALDEVTVSAEPIAPVVVFRITDHTGRAIVGADVLVRADGVERQRHETRAGGAARFDGLPSGCATVTVLADGMPTFSGRFAIEHDVDFQSILIELTPHTDTSEGRPDVDGSGPAPGSAPAPNPAHAVENSTCALEAGLAASGSIALADSGH